MWGFLLTLLGGPQKEKFQKALFWEMSVLANIARCGKNWYNSDVRLYKSASIGKASLAKIAKSDLTMDLKPDDLNETSPDQHPVNQIDLSPG